MKKIFLSLFLLLTLFVLSQNTIPDSTQKKIADLVEKQLLKPLKNQKEKFELSKFSRSYVTETYKYDLNTPKNKNNKIYTGVLKEMQGAFITERVDFEIDLKKEVILMLDEKSKKKISVEKWLEHHANEEKESK